MSRYQIGQWTEVAGLILLRGVMHNRKMVMIGMGNWVWSTGYYTHTHTHTHTLSLSLSLSLALASHSSPLGSYCPPALSIPHSLAVLLFYTGHQVLTPEAQNTTFCKLNQVSNIEYQL
jgi:hypothetical protein